MHREAAALPTRGPNHVSSRSRAEIELMLKIGDDDGIVVIVSARRTRVGDPVLSKGPFKGKRVECASTTGIERLEDIAGDFMLDIFGEVGGMAFELYSDVILRRDIAEEGLRAGDVGTLVERHVVPGVTEEGFSVEFFDMTGNTMAVVTVPASALRQPTPADRPATCVPRLAAALAETAALDRV